MCVFANKNKMSSHFGLACILQTYLKIYDAIFSRYNNNLISFNCLFLPKTLPFCACLTILILVKYTSRLQNITNTCSPTHSLSMKKTCILSTIFSIFPQRSTLYFMTCICTNFAFFSIQKNIKPTKT